MSTATQTPRAPATVRAAAGRLPEWWPLLAITLFAAALRLSTLGQQSFWFDEAFTPVYVLHKSLFTTLDHLTKTENSPPLWYIVEWVFYRVLGSGEWALRLPSALAGVALVPVAWGIGRELAGRATAIATALLIAVDPIFVWYSQEARVYGFYALASGVAMLCFLRVLRRPDDRGRLVAFAVAGMFALLTHYFTIFLLGAMAVWLLWRPETRRRAVPALAAIAVVGLALLPLIASQGGRNTNWIGEWPLLERLEAIPQYFLVGYNGGALGRSIQLLVALPLLGACGVGVARLVSARPGATAAPGEEDHRRGAAVSLWIAACGFGVPLALALAGADYLAPRNVLGAMVPTAALIAVLGTWPGRGDRHPARPAPLALGSALLALGAAGLLAITVDTDLSPRLQRADWRDLAHALPAGGPERVYTTTMFGSAPLLHYIPGLRKLRPHEVVRVSEVVETGELPLAEGAATPPPGFRLVEAHRIDGLMAYRFVSPSPRTLSEEQLRRYMLNTGEPWVIVPGDARPAR